MMRSLLWEAAQRKSPAVSQQGFFFVAEGDQISNLELTRDLKDVVDFLDDWESSRQCT